MQKLIIFDLDGTLAESKQSLTSEMAELVAKLLATTKVAIISGGALPQFLKQVIVQLPVDTNLTNLYLLPTSGAALYEFHPSTSLGAGNSDWNKIYEERLSEKEADTIETAMKEASAETDIINFSEPAWGQRIEYRGGQVSMSALGQEAPIVLKKAWDPDHTKRHILQSAIAKKLPEFSVGIGGATTIDVTKRNIDKAFGVRQLCKRIGINESDVLYIGDELEAGGNDEAIFKTEAKVKSVKNPTETERLIESILVG